MDKERADKEVRTGKEKQPGEEVRAGEKQPESGSSLEELFAGLEGVIEAMEQPEVPLEKAFELYHKGMDMLKSCNDKIDKIEKKMLVLDDEGELYEFDE